MQGSTDLNWLCKPFRAAQLHHLTCCLSPFVCWGGNVMTAASRSTNSSRHSVAMVVRLDFQLCSG